NLAKKVNDSVRDIGACITFGSTGAGCGSTDGDSVDYASGMVESCAADSWAVGVFGDRATGKVSADYPDFKLPITKRDPNPKILDTWTGGIAVPVDAIPSATPGDPTWAEVWRWTQTYTRTEARAMAQNAALRCSMNPDHSPRMQNI